MSISEFLKDDLNFSSRRSPVKAMQKFIQGKEIEAKIQKIVWEIFESGDEKLFHYTEEFDGHSLNENTVRVTKEEMNLAFKMVSPSERKLIKLAKARIERFHQKQRQIAFKFKDSAGAVIEQRVLPLERVGICIPAGRAPLFSSVLMTSIPARIAGVKQIAMISPWPKGKMNPYILTAARMGGIEEIYKVGGVQGVAALAVGTKSILNVDKIVGPGSIWVSEAKAFVARLGLVGIDTLAGPSEVVVLTDGSCLARFVAGDLISQLEHGEDSIAFLVTTKEDFAEQVYCEMESQIKSSSKESSLPISLENSFAVFQVEDIEQACWLVNTLSPEHLEIIVQNPRDVLPKIKNAASIFIGPYSPVPIGDYLAGPNHVLPTGMCARFASPLGVEDFVKRQSVVEFSKEALLKLGPAAERMAELEGLDGHAAAIRIRRESLSKKKKS